jgi:hypothetical protein
MVCCGRQKHKTPVKHGETMRKTYWLPNFNGISSFRISGFIKQEWNEHGMRMERDGWCSRTVAHL